MSSSGHWKSWRRVALLLVLVCSLLAFVFYRGSKPYLVGAHYYVWFPDNFDHGFLRDLVEPRQGPALGRYSSASPAVAEQHISWAAEAGIKFFTLNWWPKRPELNEAISKGFLSASNLAQFRFCMFYDSTGLGYSEERMGVVFDRPTKDLFVSSMVELARTYFGHPSYLRLHGRPVIILYITRVMRGLFAQAMQEMRSALRAEGYDPFVIGDEIYWIVVQASDSPDAPAIATGEPQVARIRLFDAITAYNLYDPTRLQQRGYGAMSRFIPEAKALYRRYRKAGGVPIVPAVLPGYNDRGVRPDADHYVIPRQWGPGAAEGSFFAESLDRIAKPFVDPDLRMVLITSWNEWNEDTAIEPAALSPATTRDQGGEVFTQGYTYEGFGKTYLEILRSRLAGAGDLQLGAGSLPSSAPTRPGSR